MADITWSDVTDHVANLSTVSAGAQTDILAHVNSALRVSEFGGEEAAKTKLARIYLAAHFGTLEAIGATGAAGAIERERLGDMERQYSPVGSSSVSFAEFGDTTYGKMFVALCRSNPSRAGILL